MSKIPPTIVHHFDCECHSADHTIRFTVEPGETDSLGAWPPELYCEVQLRHWRPWYKRAWVAIKYIFGYQCQYGHWDCWIMKEKDAEKLEKVLTEYKIYYERYQKEQAEYASRKQLAQQDSTSSSGSSSEQ